MRLNRRTLLSVFLGSGLVLASPLRLGAAGSAKWRRTVRSGLLDFVELLRHKRSVEEIGRAYLRAHPGMRDPVALTQSLEGKIGEYRAQGTRRLDQDRQNERVLETITNDFAEGRTVSLGGWVLAETEAQLFGLYVVSTEDSA